MERYETEEQQVEAIKRFWKENGTAIVLGAVIGLGGLWGWRYYNDTQVASKEAASDAYQATLETIVSEQGLANTETFISEHASSGYATLAGFISAQQAAEKGDYEGAKAQLQATLNNADSPAIADVARLRLARIELQLGDADAALATVNAIVNAAFSAQAAELKGDAYLAKNDFDQAKIAYTSALADDANNADVSMKLSNLGYAAATQAKADNSGE